MERPSLPATSTFTQKWLIRCRTDIPRPHHCSHFHSYSSGDNESLPTACQPICSMLNRTVCRGSSHWEALMISLVKFLSDAILALYPVSAICHSIVLRIWSGWYNYHLPQANQLPHHNGQLPLLYKSVTERAYFFVNSSTRHNIFLPAAAFSPPPARRPVFLHRLWGLLQSLSPAHCYKMFSATFR